MPDGYREDGVREIYFSNYAKPDTLEVAKNKGYLPYFITNTPDIYKHATGYANVRDYGAKGDGVAIEDNAFKDAIAAAGHGMVYVPAGTYLTSSTISIATPSLHDGMGFLGDGGDTIIKQTTASVPVITVGGFLTDVKIKNLTLGRTVAATSGGDGIYWTDSTADSHIDNVTAEDQYRGFWLSVAGNSIIQNCKAISNYSHGFYNVNTAASGAIGWIHLLCFAQFNNGDGFRFESIAGPANATTADIVNCSTFANSGHGIGVVANSSVPIHSIRIRGGFYGADGLSEVYLDTYGHEHHLTNVFAEASGSSATGRSLGTAATHVGYNYEFTSHNEEVILVGCHGQTASSSGFATSATRTTFTGCSALENGVQAIAGDKSGFNVKAGKAFFVGCRSGNNTVFIPQEHGIIGADGTSQFVVGCDFTGNTGTSVAFTANNGSVTTVGSN